MKNSRHLTAAITILLAGSILLALIPCAASAQSPKIISGSPGDTISFMGTGTPNAQVTLEVSATIDVATQNVGGVTRYKRNMEGLNIPGGNSLSITVSPVDTLLVTGSFSGVPVGMTMEGSVSNHVGSFSKSVPPATYNIVVSGVANGSPSSVSMTVRASQPQNVGGDGTFTASLSTSGLPSTVYTVKQNGVIVAMVYLGVAAPATPTPNATPTPTPSTQPAQSSTVPSATAQIITASPSSQPTPSVSISGETVTPSASTTPTPAGGGLSPWIMAFFAITAGSVIGIAAAYLLFIKKR